MFRRCLLFMGMFLFLSGCGSSPEPAEKPSVPSTPKGHLYPIKQNGKWGYINAQGKIVIPPQFNEAEEFSEGLAWADKTFIDTTGKPAIDLGPLMERQIGVERKFSDGVVMLKGPGGGAYVQNFGPVSIQMPTLNAPPSSDIMDRYGKILNLPFRLLASFSGGLAPASVNGGVAFVNPSGQIVIPAGTYWAYGECGDGLCAVASIKDPGHLWGYIDTQGQPAIAPQFFRAHGFSEGLARVSIVDRYRQAKWGYIDKTGSVVIANQYDDADDFSEGLAAVKKNGGWGFINRDGQTAVDYLYGEQPGRFHGGLARVQMDGKLAYIDTKGQFVWTSTE